MKEFLGKRVAILGLSTEGQDSVKFFSREGAEILCCDRRTREELDEIYPLLARYPVRFQLGPGYLNDLFDYDLLVRTPGMSLRLPELAALAKQGKAITSLTKLFFQFCRAPIIGVTGTKGKGTTSTLVAEMLKADGRRVYLGGNVGTPLLSGVRQIQPDALVVLELSSFQLEDLKQSPYVAVVLRTTQEHLANYDKLATNFHPSREAYLEAKKSIVRYQKSSDYALLSADDSGSSSFAGVTPAQVLHFSLTAGRGEAYVAKETVYLCRQGKKEQICRLSEIKLRGLHNLENIAAASLAASVFGVKLSAMRQAALNFPGLPHRIELVSTVRGIAYYDDSFSTVPETTIAAVNSFREPLVLILGGSEKGSDFREMGKTLARSSVKAVIVVGQMTERILAALKEGRFRGKILTGSSSMSEIFKQTQKLAIPGDVILLSPACASFDMFKNYKDRGEQFKYGVAQL